MAESFSLCLIAVTLNLKGFRKAFYACTILKLVSTSSSSFKMQMLKVHLTKRQTIVVIPLLNLFG